MARCFTGQPFGIIVGSTALSRNGFDFRKPKDIDMFLPEGCPAPEGVDCQWFPDSIIGMIPHTNGYASVDAVYTIKCSHLQWDIHWHKHYSDMMYMKAKGCRLLPELYRALSDHWKEKNGNKDFLSLNKRKDDFFNDAVEYVYDHDYLHDLVSFPNKPVYTECLKDGADVMIDKDKFFQLPFEKQIRMFKEEIAVIACERWLIPDKANGKISFNKAWGMSLRKTVTALTKGWASEFLVLNMEHFYKPDRAMVAHLFEKLKIGDMYMSNKVDMAVFEELSNEFDGVSIEELVFVLCSGETDALRFRVKSNTPEPEVKWSHPDMIKWIDGQRKVLSKIYKDFGYEHLEQEGGGEGGSEHCHGVFKLSGKIYRADYGYYSYEGYCYDSIVVTLREVKPVSKTITVYE